jgi:hypothetical protein
MQLARVPLRRAFHARLLQAVAQAAAALVAAEHVLTESDAAVVSASDCDAALASVNIN